MSPIKTKSGAPNYKGLYQATQKTLAEEREKIVELNTELRFCYAARGNVSKEIELIRADNDQLMQDMHSTAIREMQLIQQNKTMFIYVVSMAVITILVLVWGFVR